MIVLVVASERDFRAPAIWLQYGTFQSEGTRWLWKMYTLLKR